MTVSCKLASDGSGPADAPRLRRIDRSDPAERYRYVCPNGHADWDKTNSHIWCRSCRHQCETGDEIEPEHWEIYDKKTGETIPWSSVEVVTDRGAAGVRGC